MSDFLLELLSEEIPARMQDKAAADLARLFEAEIGKAGLRAEAIETHATPRRLALIARNLPAATEPVREETKGPRASAPPQALEGFLRKTGLTREHLTERDGILFAIVEKPGRATAHVLAEAIPAIVRAFPWPKSMRWGAASASTASLRWVRPLQGIVALLGEEIVAFEIDGIASGAATRGHRFHHPGPITIGSADDYEAKLRACHVILDANERRQIIRDGARAQAASLGLIVLPDEGLVAENANLTEWPIPLIGEFDPDFLEVPPEVIQLTMRTNQKYFALSGRDGQINKELGEPQGQENWSLAPAFICTANIDAADGGAGIVAGNRKVLAARLSDARFFWEQDLKVPLAEQARKLDRIVFHEKLGTVADKVERVAKLARWLVEEGIVSSSPERGGGPPAQPVVEGAPSQALPPDARPLHQPAAGPPPRAGEDRQRLADIAEQAALLCKADLVTGMVGEFPELQGIMGGYYARAEGLPHEVADAIRDHYKPVGQGDDVPTAPVTVAVSLADKLDTITSFFAIDERPSGSRDPFALRRSALGVIRLLFASDIRLELQPFLETMMLMQWAAEPSHGDIRMSLYLALQDGISGLDQKLVDLHIGGASSRLVTPLFGESAMIEIAEREVIDALGFASSRAREVLDFFADRLKVQQREAGVRHDLIDAVFALGGEDDLVRLLARVKALQAFVATEEGMNLLAGYKRAANILKKEGWDATPSTVTPAEAGVHRDAHPDDANGSTRATVDPGLRRGDGKSGGEGLGKSLSYTPEKEEADLLAALDATEKRAESAVGREDFEGAMAALAGLRAPIDAFFEHVTVNDADQAKRQARLGMLARVRDAVHRVADFSRIEG